MSDGISFDFSDLEKLAADLGEVPKNAGPNIRSAVQFTATNVKKDAAATVSQRKHFKQAAAGIDYDISGTTGERLGGITAEVGYNKSRRESAKLGNLVEFGSPGNPATNAPQLSPGNDLANALEKNQGDFQHGLEIALEDAEKKAGL